MGIIHFTLLKKDVPKEAQVILSRVSYNFTLRLFSITDGPDFVEPVAQATEFFVLARSMTLQLCNALALVLASTRMQF